MMRTESTCLSERWTDPARRAGIRSLGVAALAGISLHTAVLAPPARAQCEAEQIAKLLASDGAEFDRFGSSVSISGGTLVVGAPYHSEAAYQAGAAYVFELIESEWTETAELVASDAEMLDVFGVAVAVDGETIVIGAPADDGFAGSAYVFERIDEAWSQTAKLTKPDGGPRAAFGHSVSISGDTIIVLDGPTWGLGGNWVDPGAAYFFERVAGAWTETAVLTAADGATLAFSVSISGDTAFAAGLTGKFLVPAQLHVFSKVDGVWAQTQELMVMDGNTRRALQRESVAISGDTGVMGVVRDSGTYYDAPGSAFVFERIDGTWTEATRLRASDVGYRDHFGSAVAVSAEGIVVGAPGKGNSRGAAYTFQQSGGEWIETAKLTASVGRPYDRFGCSVGAGGDTAIIGADGDRDHGMQAGSAYVFDVVCACPADFNNDGDVNTLDVLAFLNAWSAGDASADFDGNGEVNTLDVLAFLNAWSTDC